MRKFRLFSLAMGAVLAAFCAVAAVSASAIEWLVEGAALAGELPAETDGLLFLSALSSAGALIVTIHCEGIFVGTIGPGGADLITGLLTLETDVAIPHDLEAGTPLECPVTDPGSLESCVTTAPALLWIANLPWTTSLELMETVGAEWLDMLGPGTGGEPGYEVECKTLIGITFSDLCTGLTSARVTNEPLAKNMENTVIAGVLGVFNPAAPISSESGTCTSGHIADTEGEGVTWAVNGTVAAPEYLHQLETSINHP